MSKCPHCGGDLTYDTQTPNKLLCYNCRKRYDVDKINQYWAQQGGISTEQPYQPEPVYQQPEQFSPYQQQEQPQPYQQPIQQPYSQQGGYSQPGYPPMPQKGPSKGLAVASLVIGIVSILFSWLSFIATGIGIIGLILGIVGIVKANKGTAGGKGLAIGGLVCSILGIICSVLITVLIIGVYNWGLEQIENSNVNIQNYNLENEESANQFVNDVLNAANSNSIDTSSQSHATNSSSTSNTQPPANSANAPAAGANDTNWKEGSFSFEGKKFELGKTTVRQFCDETGWTLNLADYGYEDGYLMENNSRLSAISLENNAYDRNTYVTISAENTTGNRIDLMDCPISAIMVSAYKLDIKYPECSTSGAQIGGDLEAAKNALGSPENETTNDSITSLSYNHDYKSYLTFTADNGKIMSLSLSIY